MAKVESDGPPIKKLRVGSVFERFHKFHDKNAFISSYRRLCGCFDRTNSFISNKIRACDANAEVLFSRATCHTEAVIEELYPFGSIFNRGIQILNDITGKEGHIPEDEETQALLIPLLTYLFDDKSHECLRTVKTDASKGDHKTCLTTTIAAHFFSKLSVSKSFIMDKYSLYKRESLCHCGECKEKNIMKLFDDTSIGHKDVWHGCLDIILENSEIGVQVTSTEDNRSESAEIGSLARRDQVLAQTITFSYLQQQLRPLRKHSLIPFISASDKGIQFFLYDSRNDILLESREFRFFVNGKLSYQTVIAAWLVLNYKHLCSGPTEYILKAPKADFPKFADTSLEIYQSQLKFQKVTEDTEGQTSHDTWGEIEEGWYDGCPFLWPREPFTRPPT